MDSETKRKLSKAAQNAAGGVAAGVAVAYLPWVAVGFLAVRMAIEIYEEGSDKEFAKGFLSAGLQTFIPESVENWVKNRFR